jgi:hypothetical protein
MLLAALLLAALSLLAGCTVPVTGPDSQRAAAL